MNVLDKPWVCPAPFTGFTIRPSGYITLCCQSDLILDHIDNIKSLTSFYNSDQMQYYRDAFYNNKKLLKNECQTCELQKKQCVRTRKSIMRQMKFKYINEDNKKTKKPIRFLEFTTSNICNQACSTCGPAFSSKWVSINRANGDITNKNYTLSDNNINKIIKTLPDLETLVIRGGEPFADDNNFKIIKELDEVNNAGIKLIPTNRNTSLRDAIVSAVSPKGSCALKIVSNCSRISNDTLNVLKNRPKGSVKILASIDGTNDLYRWIRSTEFNQTTSTLDKVYKATDIKFNIIITLSLYNIYNVTEIFNFFNYKPYALNVTIANAVRMPVYAAPNMLPEKELEQIKTNFINFDFEKGGSESSANYKFINDLVSHETGNRELYEKTLPEVHKWIDKMDKLRNMRLYDIVPQLSIFN